MSLMRWRAFAGYGTLGAFAAVIIAGLVHPDHEILYRGSYVTSSCPEIEGRKQCVAVYQLAIANSGDARQEEVRVEWSGTLGKWTARTNLSDLVAGTKTRRNPEIASTTGLDSAVYIIRGLEPNTVVEFKLTCALCTFEEIQAFRNAPPVVKAKGAVLNTEPRWTTFGRALRNLQRVVGLLP